MGKRVYIAYTGGTIGMWPTPQGYAVAPGFLTARLAEWPELATGGMPAFDVHEYDPLLPSSAMRPADWDRIARDIGEHYEAYDGFVVLHGTDTMAYTASALALRLQGLAKPVVLTGSQIPFYETRNDARNNLIAALLVAGMAELNEVCLCFGSKLLRGCRATKVDCSGLEAFDSPNCPPLGHVGVRIRLDPDRIAPPGQQPFTLAPRLMEPAVAVLRLFPGMDAGLLQRMLLPPLQGLVLQVYGSGSGPDNYEAFLTALADATTRGVVIVAVSQCLRGSVGLSAYAANSILARAGVVSGRDMTTEAAFCKLDSLLAGGHPPEVVRQMIGQSLCGELTPDRDADPLSG